MSNDKKTVGYIWYCCVIDFIDYVVSALLTLKASTLLIPWGEKRRKCYGIFANNFHGKPENVMGFFFQKSRAPWIKNITVIKK